MLALLARRRRPIATSSSPIMRCRSCPAATCSSRRGKIRPGIPGIIISGYADGQSIARKPSEVVVLTKPFTLDQMSAAIGAAVQPPAQRA